MTMKKNDDSFIEILRTIDAASRLKSKRLRYMRLARVSRDAAKLRDGFDGIWIQDQNYYRLKREAVPAAAVELLAGIFGNHDEARAILEANLAIVSMDRTEFSDFLARHIDSEQAREHLFRLFFGEGTSICSLATGQVSILENYLPTAARTDRGILDTIFTAKDLANFRLIVDGFNELLNNFETELRLYREFIRDFRNLYHERAGLRVMSHGEIATVMDVDKGNFLDEHFELRQADLDRWVWKKLPRFPDRQQALDYAKAYREYRDILVDELDIGIPLQMLAHCKDTRRFTVYAGQERIDSSMVCSELVKQLAAGDARTLFVLVMHELLKVYRFNRGNGWVTIGIYGRLANWVLVPATPERVSHRDRLLYIDTTSPLFRVRGKEQMNTLLFTRTAPWFLRLLFRMVYLKRVVARHYDMRAMLIDIIAGLHELQRPELIDCFIEAANLDMIETGLSGKMITRKDIDGYHAGNALYRRLFRFPGRENPGR